MKIPPAKIDEFIKKPDINCRAVLFYGPDNGLSSIRAKILHHHIMKNPSDPFSNIEINYATIRKDPSSFHDELHARSLLGSKRFIKIIDADATLPKAIADIIKNYTGNNFILLIADELSPSSSLRKLFEAEKNLAAIACYKDDQASLRQVIMKFLKEKSFTASNEAITMLSSSFMGNRLIVLNELEKLITYKGSDKSISLDDVQKCVEDNVEISLDNLCHAIAALDSDKISINLARLLEENTSAIAIIRTIMYYFMKLHLVKSEIEAGETTQQAINALKPPLFFKNVPIFEQHLRMWNIERINGLLQLLQQLESSCKNNLLPDTLLLEIF